MQATSVLISHELHLLHEAMFAGFLLSTPSGRAALERAYRQLAAERGWPAIIVRHEHVTATITCTPPRPLSPQALQLCDDLLAEIIEPGCGFRADDVVITARVPARLANDTAARLFRALLRDLEQQEAHA